MLNKLYALNDGSQVSFFGGRSLLEVIADEEQLSALNLTPKTVQKINQNNEIIKLKRTPEIYKINDRLKNIVYKLWDIVLFTDKPHEKALQTLILGIYTGNKYRLALDITKSKLKSVIYRKMLGVKTVLDTVVQNGGSVPDLMIRHQKPIMQTSNQQIQDVAVKSFLPEGHSLLQEKIVRQIIKMSGVRSFYAFPIFNEKNGELIGHISFASKEEASDELFNYWRQEYVVNFQKEYYKTFFKMDVLIAELENKNNELEQANKELASQSLQDPLTGLFNRRAWMMEFKSAILNGLEKNDPDAMPSFIMFDIDHFKKINDSRGHDVGDDVLVRVGQLLKMGLRSDRDGEPSLDKVFRMGGEEFGIILPGASLKEAIRIAERTRRRIEEEIFYDKNKLQKFLITVSAGVAQTPLEKELSVTALVEKTSKEADEMLYAAKENGRNYVAAAY